MTQGGKNEMEMNERLEQVLAKLPRDIDPPRDLWPGIEAAIGDAGRASWWPQGWQGLAAALALVVSSSLITLWVSGGGDQAIEPAPWVAADVGMQFASYPIGPQYMEARRKLSADFEARLAGLAPETRAAVQESLGDIREALNEIDAALRNDPNNVLLQQLLLAAYQDELAVLTDLNSITETITVRTDL